MPKFEQNAFIEFEDIMEIVIHEITHILGFSDYDIPQWILPKETTHAFVKKQIKGVDTLFLKTPNVLRYAREYFNCPILEGMPLQGENSKNSHWPNTILQNEYMNTSVSFTQAYFSSFTANLLRDTGYYAEINASMEEQMFYGKGKGCEYVMHKCDTAFREYCNPQTDVGLCDFYHHGFSNCKTGLYNMSNCNNLFTYDNGKCWDVNSEYNTETFRKQNGTKYGTDSRCFNGNLLSKKYKKNEKIQGNCYQYECNPNGQQVTIQVDQVKLICTKNSEQKTVDSYHGYIQCPQNIQEFCGFKKICPNFCSANGICLKNQCICVEGFIGKDCSSVKTK
ncbi:leishmanolysin family protein, putative [Ichthyophthirius multifiliis]|uniref:Leishmanolysin family protein, putative n=1 Tax=Ichthyophthirius multifiliis TaxID=5932 RepID=G0R6J7_ICHMU|nr:leishmanolysin family protein, putative [Ichthyophthirius multifiliis]EGR26905.1 leishmanolysin family protein, putative [Ichthyophthirius multifiliis]|eukprot:XP_004023789.1 leishmanolysin family protein, putative [Ichthyophthirius multifiliis]